MKGKCTMMQCELILYQQKEIYDLAQYANSMKIYIPVKINLF